MLVIKMDDDVFDEEFLQMISNIETMSNEKKKLLLAYLFERMSSEDIWDILGASISELIEKKYGVDENGRE
jgi:hypothetical protein